MVWLRISILIAICFIFDVKAQKKITVQVGITGGYTLNNIGIDGRNVFNVVNITQFFLPAPHANLAVYLHKKGKKVGLLSELGYTTKGWTEARYGGKYITRLNYLQLSLMSNIWLYTFSFKKSFFRPVLLGGIYGSQLIDYNATYEDVLPTIEGTEDKLIFPRYKFNDTSKKNDYGLIIGVGLEYERKKFKVFSDFRYYYGFLPILGEDDPGNPGFIQNNQIRVTAGILFILSKKKLKKEEAKVK